MSGLLALLDDVAALTKLAAAQLDDVATQASRVGVKVAGSVIDDTAKAGAKSLGVVIDDTAVTPKYVENLPASRELPIVWKIARGSLFNKLVILLPAALLLDAFAPGVMTPLLMLGGTYLCFEGAEKVAHAVFGHKEAQAAGQVSDAARLEEERVAGAIRTDFILSAEIMTIAMAAIEAEGVLARGVVLALVAIGITGVVYGFVALLVKADDFGLTLARHGRLAATRAAGRGIVRGMPGLMTVISTVGTAAMLWVGGSIVVHGLETMGQGLIGHAVEQVAAGAARVLPFAAAAVEWIVTAALHGMFGLALGLCVMVPVAIALPPLKRLAKALRKA